MYHDKSWDVCQPFLSYACLKASDSQVVSQQKILLNRKFQSKIVQRILGFASIAYHVSCNFTWFSYVYIIHARLCTSGVTTPDLDDLLIWTAIRIRLGFDLDVMHVLCTAAIPCDSEADILQGQHSQGLQHQSINGHGSMQACKQLDFMHTYAYEMGVWLPCSSRHQSTILKSGCGSCSMYIYIVAPPYHIFCVTCDPIRVRPG